MKKLLALLLALSMLLTLAACGGGEQTANLDDVPETSVTTDTTGETQESTDSTEGTTEATTPETTTPPTTESAHTHSYSSKVTKAATCTAEGVKTFTCSCGKSYTEPLKAKGHSHTVTDSKKATCTKDGYTKYACACGDTYTKTSTATGHAWGKWKTYIVDSKFTPGENRRTCGNCGQLASTKYGTMYQHYTDIARDIGTFTSVGTLSMEKALAGVIKSIDRDAVVDWDTMVGTRTYSIKELNAISVKLFGKTFDWTTANKVGLYGSDGSASYDAGNNVVVWTFSYGAGWGEPQAQYEATNDDNNTHYTITTTDGYTISVELVGGNYIITSIS